MSSSCAEEIKAPLCPKAHPIVELQLHLPACRGHVRKRVCGICCAQLARWEARWRCPHQCCYQVCRTCYESHWQSVMRMVDAVAKHKVAEGEEIHALREAQAKWLVSQLQAVPPKYMGTETFATIVKEWNLQIDVPFGMHIHGARNVPKPWGLRQDADPSVTVEVLDGEGNVLAKAQTSTLTNNHHPEWNEALSLRPSEHFHQVSEWDLASTKVRFSVFDKNTAKPDEVLGRTVVPMSDLLRQPEAKWMMFKDDGEAALGAERPMLPCDLRVSVVEATVPTNWCETVGSPEPAPPASRYPHHAYLMTRGTRGDVQPFVALARGLAERLGWLVTICTELSYKDFVKKNAKVDRGRIRFRPSGGHTEARLDSWGGQLLLNSKTELLQMMALAFAQENNFTSTTVFAHHALEADNEPQPVDVIVFGFTVLEVAAIVAEYCRKPLIGFILQPTIIPSNDPGWVAVNNIETKSIVETIEEQLVGHAVLNTLKTFAENRPFARWNIKKLRNLFGLPDRLSLWHAFRSLNVPMVVPMRPGTFARPSDWWDRVVLSDFIFLRNSGGGAKASLGKPLEGFLAKAREAQAFVGLMTFSSMPAARRSVLRCLNRMVGECNRDLRMIFVGKKAENQEVEGAAEAAAFVEQGKLLELERADFGSLFPRIDLFVVHGGLGTTVEALRVRKPIAITGPLLLDQRFWGIVCRDKGVGPEPVHLDDFEDVCVDFADGATDPEDPRGWQAKAKAGEWGEDGDDGVANNVDAIKKVLDEGVQPWSTDALLAAKAEFRAHVRGQKLGCCASDAGYPSPVLRKE